MQVRPVPSPTSSDRHALQHQVLPESQHASDLQPWPTQVDNTVYAPIAPGFPSAVAALQGNPSTSEGPSSKANKARTSSQTETSGSGSNSGGGGGSISMSSGSSSSGNGDDGARDRGSRGAAVDSAREPSACRVSAGAAAGAASGSGNGSRTGVGACASLPPSFPVAIVGSGIGGDCAPMDANYQQVCSQVASESPADLERSCSCAACTHTCKLPARGQQDIARV